MSYRVLTLDLSVLLPDATELIPPGQSISEVVILSIPAGVTIQLALGRNPLIDVSAPISFEPVGEDEQNNGLYWANPVALPGTVVKVIVASGGKVGALQ